MSAPASIPQRRSPQYSSALVFLRVAVILLVWLVGFLAFLVAPLLALLLIWIVGMAWIAARKSSATPSGSEPVHRFGNGNGNGGRS